MDDVDACILHMFPCLIKKKLTKTFNKTFDEATQDGTTTC